jgi:hypothetical protein
VIVICIFVYTECACRGKEVDNFLIMMHAREISYDIIHLPCSLNHLTSAHYVLIHKIRVVEIVCIVKSKLVILIYSS